MPEIASPNSNTTRDGTWSATVRDREKEKDSSRNLWKARKPLAQRRGPWPPHACWFEPPGRSVAPTPFRAL